MRERIIGNDLTVLFVSTSNNWSTLERRVLFDATYLRDIGGNPVIFCLKDSVLDQEAEKESISRLYISKRKRGRLIDIGYTLELKKLISENRFDIIHCYGLFTCLITAFLLKSDIKTPLFLTFNQHLGNILGNSFSRWLVKRVDHIFTLNSDREAISDITSISMPKIRFIGCGIEHHANKDEVKVSMNNKVSSLGCVASNLTELKRLYGIVKIFRILKNHGNGKFDDLSLNIFLGPNLLQHEKTKRLITELEHEFYKGDIFLLDLDKKFDKMKTIDVLIGISFEEPFNDYEIMSLLQAKPILFPRTAPRQNILFKYQNIGESYKDGDVREGMLKLSKILTSIIKYRSAISDQLEELVQEHGISNYTETLQSSYEKSYTKRRRFLKSRL